MFPCFISELVKGDQQILAGFLITKFMHTNPSLSLVNITEASLSRYLERQLHALQQADFSAEEIISCKTYKNTVSRLNIKLQDLIQSALPLISSNGRERLILRNPSRSQHTCMHCSFPGLVKEDRVSLVLRSSGLSQFHSLPGDAYAVNNALSPEGSGDDYETCLKILCSYWCVVDKSSGSGFPILIRSLSARVPDGHVASLFHGHPFLEENQFSRGAGKAGW
ncbi:6-PHOSPHOGLUCONOLACTONASE 3 CHLOROPLASTIC [Salix koriyanagi]|uniref:6-PHOSPHOGLUCONOLACTONASE 3 CHLOROPLASTIC n=1 Tax=Salix koriyanagi TaxID=2511006 RepID=A0A9Q0SRK1_9ROSI|nr:6-PHOSPHOGLUCONOLACTONASE 3 CHLOROPLASTIC [Salix koriyanagi]